MRCSQCKTELPDDSAFCHSCGARVLVNEEDRSGAGLPASASASQEPNGSPGRGYCKRCGQELGVNEKVRGLTVHVKCPTPTPSAPPETGTAAIETAASSGHVQKGEERPQAHMAESHAAPVSQEAGAIAGAVVPAGAAEEPRTGSTLPTSSMIGPEVVIGPTYEYRVEHIWAGFWGGFGSESHIQDVVNRYAGQGWRLRDMEASTFMWWFWPLIIMFLPRHKILLVFERQRNMTAAPSGSLP
jgi:hypothetical protein